MAKTSRVVPRDLVDPGPGEMAKKKATVLLEWRNMLSYRGIGHPTSYCESSARPARLRFWRARATLRGPLVVMSLTSVSATVPAVI